MPKPLKPYRSYDELVDLFRNRGMVIEDHECARCELERISYYRLTGYTFPFLGADGKFKRGFSFDQAIRLYGFDKRIRSILFCYLETIEVFARSVISHEFTKEYGSGGHYDEQHFADHTYHKDFITSMKLQITHNSSAKFVNHHIRVYGGNMPLWAAAEIMTFTTLSKFYSNLLPEMQELIASTTNAGKASYLRNWLHCFSVLRNACAHFGRLYGETLSPSISLGASTLKKIPIKGSRTLFAYVIAMVCFLPNKRDAADLCEDLSALFREFGNDIDISQIGFPTNWPQILMNDITYYNR
ncbi:MAG: Abi family protein [Oscillospiraceae bacterium]|jgi:abortive infection bacteriophage resistance protein|nr:Abi family protein [Oscillospiraceae bacterium]